MYQSLSNSTSTRRGIEKNHGKNQIRREEETVDSLVNCDNKTNHCNLHSSDALLSGQNRSKLSIDDESSHPINGSNTNNKSKRKRNINTMLNDGDKEKCSSVMVNSDDACDVNDSLKRMKVDGNVDGQDNNKSKMYQVSIKSKWISFDPFFCDSDSFEMYLILIEFSK